MGPERNLFDPQAASAHQIELRSPMIFNHEMDKLRALDGWHGFRAHTLSTVFRVAQGEQGLAGALDMLWRTSGSRGSRRLARSSSCLTAGSTRACAHTSLLSCAAVHHHLLREGTRTRTCLVVESGEPREVHDFCLLIGYGASAVNPYLALEVIETLAGEGVIRVDTAKARTNYAKAISKGLVKVISKMGISTVQSYHGRRCSRPSGFIPRWSTSISLATLPASAAWVWVASRGGAAPAPPGVPSRSLPQAGLDPGGEYRFRSEGEHHLFNPESISKLQVAVRTGSYEIYKQYAQLINDQSKNLATLRGLMELRHPRPAVPIDEVESVEEIVKRFKTGPCPTGRSARKRTRPWPSP